MANALQHLTPSQGMERPAKATRMGTGAPSRAAPVQPPRTDLLAFMRQVKTACCLPPGNHDRERAVQVLKSDFGSEWQVIKAALGEGGGANGGYLLPTAISLKLLHSLVERAFIFPRAIRVDMTSRTVQAPIFDLGSGALGQSPFIGGMSWAWEQKTPVETEPTFALVDLTNYVLSGWTRISNQALEDAGPEAEDLYVKLFAMAAGFQAEYAFMQGLGAASSSPLGMINAPCAVQVARAAPNAIASADVAGVAGHMYPEGWHNAIWVVNPSAIPQLFAITQFTPNFPSDGSNKGCCGYIYTRPVFPSEKVPKLGSYGDLVFCDPSAYVVGVRQEVVVAASEHSRFANNQTEFFVALRVDGKPLMNNSVTLADGSTNASMVVALK